MSKGASFISSKRSLLPAKRAWIHKSFAISQRNWAEGSISISKHRATSLMNYEKHRAAALQTITELRTRKSTNKKVCSGRALPKTILERRDFSKADEHFIRTARRTSRLRRIGRAHV